MHLQFILNCGRLSSYKLRQVLPKITTKVQINYHTTNCDGYSKLRRLNKVLYSAFLNISMQVNFIVILKQALSTSHFLSLTNLDQ